MAISDWPAAERPRVRLLAHGPGHLSDAELYSRLWHEVLEGHLLVAANGVVELLPFDVMAA